MDFCDTTDDEMDVNLQLAERLRINRGDNLSSNQQLNVNGLYRKKKLFIDPSSSSSSVDDYNEPSSSHLPNSYGRKKKRQIKDKSIDQLAKSKRTCLSEGMGLKSADAKHDSVKPPSKNYCINRISDENDSDFDFTSFPPYNKHHLKTMKNSKMLKNTEKPQDCALPYGAQSIYRVPIIESASDDDDSRLVIQKGTLKGGRQSPDKKTVKKVIGRKTKKSMNNDKRKYALVFSSSDTDEYALPPCSKEDSCPNVLVNSSSSSNDANQIHSNLFEGITKRNSPNIEILHSLPPDLGYPVSQMCKKSEILKKSGVNNLHNGINSMASTSADNYAQSDTSNPGVPHKNRNTFPPPSCLRKSSWKHQPATKSIIDSMFTEVLDVHDQNEMDPNAFSVPNRSTFPSQSIRRLRNRELPNGASNDVHKHPNVLEVQDDGEVENFFTANSDTESNSGSLRNSYRYEPVHSTTTGFSLLRSSDLPARNAHYLDPTVSSEDEICVVYSSEQNKPKSNPPKNEKSTKAKTPVRRKNGTRQRPNLAKLVNIVSSSPDPVEQVRQVEEDERLARMLQAQFDSERDPTYLPISRESSSSSSDVCVDEPLANHFQISQNFAFSPSLVNSVSPIRRPAPRTRSSRRPRRQIMNFSNPFLPDPESIFGRFNFDLPPISMSQLFGTDNDYERLINLGEMNGDVSRGLHQREINRLPTRIFIMHTSEQLHKRAQLNKECQVCLSDYADGDNLRILPCFHEFHIPCIDPWLLSNRTCPVCRVVVNLDESSNLPE